MRKASKILGLIAAIFTLVLSIVFIAYNIYLINAWADESTLQSYDLAVSVLQILFPGILSAIAGILGLIAAAIINKHHTTSGALMIIGATLCACSIFGAFSFTYFISIALFIIASVFALKTERPEAVSQPNGLPTAQPDRKQGKVLGFTGSSVALVISILITITNIGYINANPRSYENANISEAMNIFLFMVPAIVNFIVGILGLTSALIIQKHHKAAGVLMIIGAAICIFGFMNIISMVLLIIGSVYALKPDRPAQMPPQAAPSPSLPQNPQP